jgi:hypothetical protein
MTTMTTMMLRKPMTTMMLRKHTLIAMFRCASHVGTLDRPRGKGSVFLSRSGKWRFSAVGGEQTKKTVLKFKISQK